MEWLEHIGMPKVTYELLPINSTSTTSSPRSIWQMMPFRSITQNMVAMSRTIRFPMKSFNAICSLHFPTKNITSKSRFCPKWKKWQQMQLKVYTQRSPPKTTWITSRSSGSISWSIRISGLGLLKSIQTLVWIAHARC